MAASSRRLPRVTELAHLLIERFVQEGDRVVDATVGNGHDTLFLSDLVGPGGKVYGFDIQMTAIDAARIRVGNRDNVQFIHAGHELLSSYVAEEVRAVMFNLGYLPRGDKAVTTLPDTTLQALTLAYERLSTPGVISIVVYPGHEGGKDEAVAVDRWIESLDLSNTSCARWVPGSSRSDFPYLIAVEKP